MNPSSSVSPNFESKILQTGKRLWVEIRNDQPTIFDKHYWQDKLMGWVMQDPTFKVDMFHFIDVLPGLKTSAQIAQHIREYLLKKDRPLPLLVKGALLAAVNPLTRFVAAKTIQFNVMEMARSFIIGKDGAEAISVLKKLHDDEGLGYTVDLLGEATVTEEEADVYQQRYMELIDSLSKEVVSWKNDPILTQNHLGTIPVNNVSIKISALSSQIDYADSEGSVERLMKRTLPLFLHAKSKNVFINVDLEQWDMHDITYRLFRRIVLHPELKSWPHIGIVIQAYIKHSMIEAQNLLKLSQERGTPLTIRLVKGAYWDFEVVNARQKDHECPVFTNKGATDENYEAITRFLLDNINDLQPAFGSHNLRSLVHAMTYAEEKGIPKNAWEIQMLYGMGESIRRAMRRLGYRVRLYSPVGDPIIGMAYLVRRLLENTSNSGFLRLSFQDHVDIEKLLHKPEVKESRVKISSPPENTNDARFKNAYLADFSDDTYWEKFSTALVKTKNSFPVKVFPILNGKAVASTDTFFRVNPSDTSFIVSEVRFANRETAEQAVQNAWSAFPAWRDTALTKRIDLLNKLADLIEENRHDLTVLLMFESGKPIKEADGDVGEAIDFCRYYAHRAEIEFTPRQQGNMWGEVNTLTYQGRGPSVVIAPWNFPLAILCGMSTAALVAGNPIIMKPSEQTGAIGYALYELMMKAGFPAEVVQFLPGRGEVIGDTLVEHPLVAHLTFTGSKQVGLSIIEKASKTLKDQPQVKRVVCEMGGKNAIIVDESADYDEAITGILHGAFGYAGQKCSATSRLILVGQSQEPVQKRLIEAMGSLLLRPAHDLSCKVPPVIDEETYKRLMDVVNDPGCDVEVLYRRKPDPSLPRGFYVPPTLLKVNSPDHFLMQTELFGPILTIIHVKDFDEALRVVNGTAFALTSAIYSRTPGHLERAFNEINVGNLYLNHSSTGSMVGRQPFGGHKMSGVGTKAGGPYYLMHFVDPRVITENTMRRGFTPEIES